MDLVRVGLWEVAIGAQFGWLVGASIVAPQFLARIGIVQPRRVLQAHLEYMGAGAILVGIGLAVDDLPHWCAIMLPIALVLAPTAYLPLAFRPRLADNIAYRALNTVNLLAASVGLIVAAASY
jgi:hypothetical protein